MIRKFETGATRDTEQGKFDYEGFLSPLALERYAAYMHKHRVQSDGSLRESDNWQKGIPLDAYMKSGWRHFMDWFKYHRGTELPIDIEDVLCAVIFNAMGYLHEIIKKRRDPRTPEPISNKAGVTVQLRPDGKEKWVYTDAEHGRCIP